jgi:hypothetical protein
MKRLHSLKKYYKLMTAGLLFLLSLIIYSQAALANTGLEGAWSSQDNIAVIFRGNQYQLSENDQVVDKGTFQIQGNVLTTQSAVSGSADLYAFQRQGKILYLQDVYGQVYQFNRTGTAGGLKNRPSSQPPANGYQHQNLTGGTSAQITRVLVGKWKDIRSSGHTIIEIYADGTFSYYSDSTASGQFYNQYGENTGNWGYGNQNSTRGRWTAKGTPHEGTIYYQSQNGEQGTLDYQIMIENGRTYWNECYFDGTLYHRT